jgi:hypothetical protein
MSEDSPMENSSVVNNGLLSTIKELQSLPGLNIFALAGGTSLAIRFNHRHSYDIDLFTNQIIGVEGFTVVEQQLKEFYKDALVGSEIINAESGDQYCFLRAFVNREGETIKIEILQNMAIMYPIEMYEDIRIISVRDIGLFKLMSAANRKADKDIYDLDFITDDIALPELLTALQEKRATFCEDTHKCLFDLDDEVSPHDNPALLLEFDNKNYAKNDRRPNHSSDRLDLAQGSKSWIVAKSSWRRKVRKLMQERGISLPSVKPIN